MKTGEYKFNHIDHIEINKSIMDNLYASALYWVKDKYILEALVPSSFSTKHHEVDPEIKYNVGDGWAQNIQAAMDDQWPLANANYYIEVNGIKIGENTGSSTNYRYEPERIEENEEENIKYIEETSSQIASEEEVKEIAKLIKQDVEQSTALSKEDSNDIFMDEELKEALQEQMSALLELNEEYGDDEDGYLKYCEKQKKIERNFFRKFRSSVNIPDYLKKESMVIADLAFRGKDSFEINNKIKNLKFIIKSYRKSCLTRIKFQLPFGKYEEPVEVLSKEWQKHTDKILIEGLVEEKREDKDGDNHIPKGKKAIYIIYEIIDNALIQPIFHTTELLMSYTLSDHRFENPKLLKDKGINGFNKYKAFLGYVDENEVLVDFELFQLVVTDECNKEYKLI